MSPAITLCNEGTIRDWVRHGKFNVTQGKNFEASGSLGPFMVTADEVAGQDVAHRDERQWRDAPGRHDRPHDLQMPTLISYISRFCTLEPGDVIVTGTPTGAGARFDPPRYLKPGDRTVEVEAENIGVLRNGVVDEAIMNLPASEEK